MKTSFTQWCLYIMRVPSQYSSTIHLLPWHQMAIVNMQSPERTWQLHLIICYSMAFKERFRWGLRSYQKRDMRCSLSLPFYILLQALSPVWTSTTCWSTMSTMWKTSCRCMSCLLAGWSGTCPWTLALWPEWAARRNTLTSSTSSHPSLHQVILSFHKLCFSCPILGKLVL